MQGLCSFHFTGTERHGSPITQMVRAQWRCTSPSECWEWVIVYQEFSFNSCSKEFGPYLFHSLVTSHKSEYNFFYCTSFFCFHSWKSSTLATNKSWLKKTRPETGRSQPERFLESSNGKWISNLTLIQPNARKSPSISLRFPHITISTQSQLFLGMVLDTCCSYSCLI